MTLSFLAENPAIASDFVLVALVAFAIGFMVGDCVGFSDGLKIIQVMIGGGRDKPNRSNGEGELGCATNRPYDINTF